MALSVKANQVAGPAVTGDSATTDPGFQPKGVMIWGGAQASAGASASAEFSLGVASSSTTENASGYNSLDAAASSDVVRLFNTAAIVDVRDVGATTARLAATFVSNDVNGFTTNWATLDVPSPLYNYLALGGTDITNVATGNFAASTSTGEQPVTGVGFEPDVIFLFANINTASGATNNNSCYTFGVATSATDCWALGLGLQHNQVTMNNRRALYTGVCFMHPAAGSSVVEATAAFVSMDSDGFTIDWTDAPGQADLIGYMAVKGGQWKAGTDTQKTSTGTKATTGVGFQPSSLVLGSICDATTDSILDNARLCLGSTSGSSNNVAAWTGDRDNVADSIANTIMSATKCMVMATEGASASPTTDAEAELDSFDSDGFTLDWTTADGTARTFGYVAVGADPVGGTTVKDIIGMGIVPFAR